MERKKAPKKIKVSSIQLRKSKKRKINGIYGPLNEWVFIHLILLLSYSLGNYRVAVLEGPWRGHFRLRRIIV